MSADYSTLIGIVWFFISLIYVDLAVGLACKRAAHGSQRRYVLASARRFTALSTPVGPGLMVAVNLIQHDWAVTAIAATVFLLMCVGVWYRLSQHDDDDWWNRAKKSVCCRARARWANTVAWGG